MTRTITSRIVFNIEQRLFFAQVALLLALFAGYVYFISASIVNVVLRQEAMVEISNLHSAISEREAEYFTRKQSLDIAFAKSEGFTDLSSKRYITEEGGKVVRSD